MSRRRKAREIVLQALYECEFSDEAPEAVLERRLADRASGAETAEYARRLFARTVAERDALDAIIRDRLEHWAMDRVALIDRNILRFALAEVLHFPDVPSRVIIDEAIEIAHQFSSEDAGRFINGLVDRFVHEFRGDAR